MCVKIYEVIGRWGSEERMAGYACSFGKQEYRMSGRAREVRVPIGHTEGCGRSEISRTMQKTSEPCARVHARTHSQDRDHKTNGDARK
jgi:hypothetical protein